MEKKELEKKVDTLFKEQCANIVIPNYKLKLKKRHIEILNSDNSIEGDIYYEFFSQRFCELGAITTLDLYGCIDNGVIGQILNDIVADRKSGHGKNNSVKHFFQSRHRRKICLV